MILSTRTLLAIVAITTWLAVEVAAAHSPAESNARGARQASETEYEDYVQEDAVAPPPPPARVLPGLQRQARGPLLRNNAPKAQQVTSKPSTTAAPEPPPAEEPVYDDEVDPTTTTEAPKKGIRGGVRPFRSNTDLIAALKRRRQMQAANGGVIVQSTTTAAAPAVEPTEKSFKNGNLNRRNKVISPSVPIVSDQAGSDSLKKSVSTRRFSPRSKPQPAPQVQEAEAEEPQQEEASPSPSRSRMFGRGRKF